MNENYRDQDGTPCTLEWLVRHEPEWAASRIRIERSERELLTVEVERLKAELIAAQAHDQRRKCAGCGYAWATHHVAVGIMKPESNTLECVLFLAR